MPDTFLKTNNQEREEIPFLIYACETVYLSHSSYSLHVYFTTKNNNTYSTDVIVHNHVCCIPYDSNLHFDDIIFLSNGFPEWIS